MAPRVRKEEKKIIQELPDEFKILKMDIMDYVFSKAQADYYFSLLFGLDIKRSQRRTEDLFKRGALIKIHSEKDAKPTLYPTPPTFMFFVYDLGLPMVKKHKKTIEKLEEIYYERFCKVKDSFLKQKLIFFTGKGVFFQGLRFFLVKKFLKEEMFWTIQTVKDYGYYSVELAIGKELMKKVSIALPSQESIKILKDFKQVKIIDEQLLGEERMTTIDEKFYMHFFSLRDNRNERLLTGYITTDLTQIKNAKKRFIYLNNLTP